MNEKIDTQNQFSNFTIIDNSLFLDKRISSTDIIVYGLIASLSNNEKRACYCSNDYLANIKNITIRQIQRCLNKLKKYNYITITYDKKQRLIQTYIDYQVYKRNFENNLIDYDWINGDEND